MPALSPTSRRAAPAPKELKRRRDVADKRLALEIKLAPQYAEVAKLDTELKKIAANAGESFKEDFGERGYVSAAPPHAAEFKGDVPVVVTEKWNALSAVERKRLVKTGLVMIEKQWGKASNGRVTVKAL